MKFRGKKPETTLHRKINGERRCICGALLTVENGDWVHPEVNEEDDIAIKECKDIYEDVWIVRIAKVNYECPFKSTTSNECLYPCNKSIACKKENCKIRIT